MILTKKFDTNTLIDRNDVLVDINGKAENSASNISSEYPNALFGYSHSGCASTLLSVKRDAFLKTKHTQNYWSIENFFCMFVSKAYTYLNYLIE